MIQHKKDMFDKIHTPMKKALTIGTKVVETGLLAKGLWDIGSKIVQGVRTIAPVAGALL